MNFCEFFKKVKKKIWSKAVRLFRKYKFYPKLYRSFWHSKFHNPGVGKEVNYLTAVPNSGAGIGHQMANWIAGYWFSKQFNLKFAHTPFSSLTWETLLDFGNNEICVETLNNNEVYSKVRLPLFSEKKREEINMIKSIIASYQDKKVVFICEQDQFYGDQFGVIDDIKQKFYNSLSRKADKLIYQKTNFNISIHIRRGDIVLGQTNGNENLKMRWQDNNYFFNVLTNVLQKLETSRRVEIYLFSIGEEMDFSEFKQFTNMHFCLHLNAQESFLHMVYADLLITSKSSFSYKPALLSNGIKVCPKNFWHGYPDQKNWILASEDGSINVEKIGDEISDEYIN